MSSRATRAGPTPGTPCTWATTTSCCTRCRRAYFIPGSGVFWATGWCWTWTSSSASSTDWPRGGWITAAGSGSARVRTSSSRTTRRWMWLPRRPRAARSARRGAASVPRTRRRRGGGECASPTCSTARGERTGWGGGSNGRATGCGSWARTPTRPGPSKTLSPWPTASPPLPPMSATRSHGRWAKASACSSRAPREPPSTSITAPTPS